ncbi:MAG: hypothetical protein Tsb006_1620 [Rickettsiaceae bacterium]
MINKKSKNLNLEAIVLNSYIEMGNNLADLLFLAECTPSENNNTAKNKNDLLSEKFDSILLDSYKDLMDKINSALHEEA